MGMFVLVAALGIGVKKVNQQKETIVTSQAATQYRKVSTNVAAFCAKFNSPPQGTTIVYKSQTNFQIDFANCGEKLTNLTVYIYKFPKSISDESTKVELFKQSFSDRIDEKYCLFGFVSAGNCAQWNTFYSQPSILMMPPLSDGNQAPGYILRADFCFANNQGCWEFDQSFWINHSKDYKYCTAASDCGCKSYGSSCQIINKSFGSTCTIDRTKPASQAFCSGATPACILNQCAPASSGLQ